MLYNLTDDNIARMAKGKAPIGLICTPLVNIISHA